MGPPHSKEIYKKSISYASDKFSEHSTRVEFILALIISISLISSLIIENLFKIPFFVTTLLIFAFIFTKIYNIIEKKGNIILEDILSLGILLIFLIIRFFMDKSLSSISIASVSLVLLYSIGLMPKIDSLTESRSAVSFLVSYLIFVIIIIFLFSSFYSTNNSDFLQNGKNTSLDFRDCLYFSTITFTTVGFGDISPLETNRMISSIEALIGSVLNIAFVGYILSVKKVY